MMNDEENKNIIEILSNLRSKYLKECKEKESLIEERKSKIAEAERAITLAYEDRINEKRQIIDNSTKELSSYSELLRIYSTFDSQLIGKILEKLVTMIEGEEYSFQRATQDTTKRESTVFGSETFPAQYQVRLIVQGEQHNGYYRDFRDYGDSIYELVQKGKAILLDKTEGHQNKNIQFYTAHYGVLKSLVEYGKFDYVKEFINNIISYRFQNSLDNISEKELLTLMSDFISKNSELITSNFLLRTKEKQEKLEKELLEQQEEYNRKMEALEFERIMQEGIASKYTTNLVDRLQEATSVDSEFAIAINQLPILYAREKNMATLSYEDPFVSSEGIFISKVNINASIKSYYDDSDSDHHFHGFVDIDLADDGLAAIVDVSESDNKFSSLSSLSTYGLNCPFDDQVCRIDKIGDNYLRILFLPNKAEYNHRPINYYGWIAEILTNEMAGKKTVDNDEKDSEPISYKTDWNYEEEANKMLEYAKEIELVSSLSTNQLKLYKQKVMTRK